jgi:hypothetical protein
MSKIDQKVVETARAFDFTEGQPLDDSNGDWTIISKRVETWSDVGELRRDVLEHTRLMAAMNMIMNDKGRSEVFMRKTLEKDIGDSWMLRRVRVIEFAALTDSARAKLVLSHHSRIYREKALGKKNNKSNDGGPG